MAKSSGSINDLKLIKFPEIVSKTDSPFAPETGHLAEEFFDSGFEIQVIKGKDKGKTFPLNKKEITLAAEARTGQEKEGHILFSDRSVTGVQAELKWDGELGRYVIYHKSSDNETIVNGRSVKKSILHPDYRVKFGKVEFTIVSLKEKRLRESAVMWQEFKTGEKRGEEFLETGYKLVVVEGPDKGESFKLDKNLMIIGRRKGDADMRDTYGILLSDEKIPEELALLVWSSDNKKFEIYQSEKSPIDIKLFRVVESQKGGKKAGRDYNNLLDDKDSIRAGNTVMVVHKTTSEETEDVKIDIEKELSQILAEPKGEALGHTAPGHFRIDYVFEILEGKDQGHKISLLSDEIKEGRIITFGAKGEVRQNDIEIDDQKVSNIQGYFEFSKGSLYLVNEVGPLVIYVNNYEISENEKIVLNGGDRIKIGDTVLGFTDNRVIAALKKYRLIVLSGAEKDMGKRFPLERTMMFIGRGSSCDIRIHDREVSRLHAVLSFKNGRFQLEHKSKVNPTFVNGVSLKRGQNRIIFPSDKIYLSNKSILQLIRTKK